MKKLIIILAICALALAAGCGSDTVVDKDEAMVICQNAFEDAAKYESDSSALDATTFDLKDAWVIKLPGKMQTPAGAWRKVTAHCKVSKTPPEPKDHFSPKAITEFELIAR